MNPTKEILDDLESFKQQQIKLIYTSVNNKKEKSKETKINPKALISKEITLFQNKVMGFFSNVINFRDSLILIEQISLDQKIWSLLTERINIIMKSLDKLVSTKDIKKEEIYDVIIEDLKNVYNFYKVVYLMVCDKFFSERLVSSFLFYLGELKKMKIIVKRKFNKEDNQEKDSKECLRFYHYSLNKNPYNIRVYFNIGLVMRECLKDYTNSSYWFVRSLAASGLDSKNLKVDLEMDFNIIRKIYNEKEYLIDTNPGYINYDVEHLPLIFHRLMGIYYMSIDTDKIEELSEGLELILEKILKYYYNINEELKLEIETKEIAEQLSIMLIFNFHYTLNNLSDYPKENEKIITQQQASQSNIQQTVDSLSSISQIRDTTINNLSMKEKEMSLSVSVQQKPKSKIKYELYNHKIFSNALSKSQLNSSSSLDTTKETKSIKYGFKYVCQTIKTIINKILDNYNYVNEAFSEKIILIFFYWFSINYDIAKNLILSKETEKKLEYIHYKLSETIEKNDVENMIQLVNLSITPLEINLLAFIPLSRFFDIYGKKNILKVDESFDIDLQNKLVLAHFLNLFGIGKSFDEEMDKNYQLKQNEVVTTTVIRGENEDVSQETTELLSGINKQSMILNVKKFKPLILLDMSNIAMRHGNSEKFSTKGIKLCLDFFIKNGHEVSGFLPEYLFKDKEEQKTKSGQIRKIVPDDVNYLKDLHSKGFVIQTPSQDYDDSYNIQYCKSKNAYFVTNDLYRDYLDKINDSKQRESEKRWIISKRISYTFNKDEFIPGPDSEFFKEFNYNLYLKTLYSDDSVSIS